MRYFQVGDGVWEFRTEGPTMSVAADAPGEKGRMLGRFGQIVPLEITLHGLLQITPIVRSAEWERLHPGWTLTLWAR